MERYAHRLTFATGFGPEGCVLIDLIGRERLPIDLFTLDTGLFFEETHALWRGLEKRYGLTIRRVAPASTLDEQAQAHGDRLWQRAPDRCCAIRKVAPLEAELASVDAWITAIRRDSDAATGRGAGGGVGREVRNREDQPAGRLDEAGRPAAHRRT